MVQLFKPTTKFRSISALEPFRLTLQIFGFIPSEHYKTLYFTLAVVNNIITFYFPVSLIVYLFYLDAKVRLISSLSQTSCQILIALKVVNIFIKRKQFFHLCEQLNKLDARASSEEESNFLKDLVKTGRWFLFSFASMYGCCGVLCAASVVITKTLYPTWFPWDTENSTTGYYIAFSYEMIGIFALIYLGFIGDTYLGLLYWLLKGHIKALGMRVANIGYDPNKSDDENYQGLVDCIKDHEMCLCCYNICQDISSQIMLLQFILTQFILGMTALYFVFINDDLFETIYCFIYFSCMIMEISLCCYCGSELIKESSDFTKALYSCNWMDQNLKFRKVLIIFMQHTQKPWIIWAGGIVTVSVETWLTVLKATYSLFAVLIQMA